MGHCVAICRYRAAQTGDLRIASLCGIATIGQYISWKLLLAGVRRWLVRAHVVTTQECSVAVREERH
jgi:hypothetical protein